MGQFLDEAPKGQFLNDIPQDSTLPNSSQVDSKIAQRSDLLSGVIDSAKNASLLENLNPITPFKRGIGVLGGVANRLESSIANPAGEIQKGNFNPSNLLDAMVKGAKGHVVGQFGDLVRRTGVGGDYNEALASTTGLLAALALPDPAHMTGKALLKGTEKAVPKVLDQTGKAVQDAITNKTGFLEDIRSAFYEAKQSAVDKYGEGLEKLATDNPDKAVNLRFVVDDLNKSIQLEPKLQSAVNRVPMLKMLLDNPQASHSIPLKDAQDLVNSLQSRVSSGKLHGIGVRPDDIPLLDTIHDMKKSMVDSFPDIADLRKGYGEVIQKFNALRGKFKPGSLEQNVQKGFGDVEQKQMAKSLLQDSPEILQRMRNYALLRKAGKALGGAALAGAGYGILHH